MGTITSSGFIRDSLTTLVAQEKENFIAAFGSEISTDDDSVFGQLATVVAEKRDRNEQLLESALATQTLAGAEGIYLDDILGKYVPRRGRQSGSGEVLVQTNELTPNNFTLPSTTDFNVGGSVYRVSEDVLLTEVVKGYRLTLAQMQAIGTGNYIFTIRNPSTDALVVSPSINLSGTTPALINAFMTTVANFIIANTEEESDTTYVDSDNTILYSGFDSDQQIVGWETATEFRADSTFGNKYNAVNVTAIEPGFNPVTPYSTFDVSPSFSGLVDATNPTEFASGSEVETDAEYTFRYFNQINRITNGTRDAIHDAVDDLDGVEAVKIYPNPTNTFRNNTNPQTFQVVVIGGTPTTINQTIYNTKPINDDTDNLATGAIPSDIDTADGDVETVSHTPGTRVDISIRVDYSTLNRQALSDSERASIVEALINVGVGQRIGDTLYNLRLQTAVLDGVTSGRIISLSVFTKLEEDPETSYTTNNFNPTFTQLPTIKEGNIFFNQIL